MRKIPCLFQRDFSNPRAPVLLREVTPGCEWVLDGLGTASTKWDGTACAVINGELYARYDAKRDKRGVMKTPPEGAIPCTDAPDEVTGHWPHWVKVGDNPQHKWHAAAWKRNSHLVDGTYELCGPHFSANPHGFPEDTFVRHGWSQGDMSDVPRDFDGLETFLRHFLYEGIVYLHQDGVTRCKIRRDDFGFPWPLKAGE